MGGGWSTPRPGRFTTRKEPLPIVQEAGWGTRAGLDGCGKINNNNNNNKSFDKFQPQIPIITACIYLEIITTKLM